MKNKFSEMGCDRLLALLFIMLFICIICAGCLTNTKNNTTTTNYDPTGQIVRNVVKNEQESYFVSTYKFLSYEINVYALAASMYDPTTGNFSPYLKLGIFKEKYKSFPVVPGQSFGSIDEEYNSDWWSWTTFFTGTQNSSTSLISRNIVYIGTVPDGKKELSVTTGSGVGLTIDKHGVTIPNNTKIELK
ncbi:MAG: hypothetical protein WCV67_03170 [Victivallaceae bacterium]|jgi:hypothetical protein